MARRSAIEWTESTWNPVTGCSKVSPGCANCYAERMARRLQAMGSPNYANGFRLTLHEHVLPLPLAWRRPQMVFVNSMSDLFHERVPEGFIQKVFGVMRQASWHQFQVLTKRAERLAALSQSIDWPPNVWMGVSVEGQHYTHRVDDLRTTGARVKFVSFEPLLGPVAGCNLQGTDWVIVGGESGPGARRMDEQWVLDIKDDCLRLDIPFFFKQWGGPRRTQAGRHLRGRTWDQMPAPLAATP